MQIHASRKGKRARAGTFRRAEIKSIGEYLQPADQAVTRTPADTDERVDPKPLFRSWTEIRGRIQAAKELAVFLDFDGTLVGLRRRPGDVRVPRRIKRVLESLAGHENVFVAIVSGRRLRDLQTMFDVQGVHTFGLHGAESEGRKTALRKITRRALARTRRDVRSQLGILPGIWIEDKILSLAVHYRGASPAIVREADAALLRIVAPLRHNISAMSGEKVWEILPREIAGKGATVREVLADRDERALAIYAGDDTTDESAFAAIPDQITVKVGNKNKTCAQFFVRSPADVLRFLTRLEKELS